MAMPREPITGIIPMAFPHFFPFSPNRIPITLEKAPKGPVFMLLPNAISPITPENPSRITNIKYGIKNAAPPNLPVRYGNIQMFPMPTADPMQATINPSLVRNSSLPFSFPLDIISLQSFCSIGKPFLLAKNPCIADFFILCKGSLYVFTS